MGSYYNDSPKKRGVIAYSRWSYRGSKCKVLTGKNFVLWIGGRLREVVPHAGSSIVTTCTLTGRNSIFYSSQYGELDNPNLSVHNNAQKAKQEATTSFVQERRKRKQDVSS